MTGSALATSDSVLINLSYQGYIFFSRKISHKITFSFFLIKLVAKNIFYILLQKKKQCLSLKFARCFLSYLLILLFEYISLPNIAATGQYSSACWILVGLQQCHRAGIDSDWPGWGQWDASTERTNVRCCSEHHGLVCKKKIKLILILCAWTLKKFGTHNFL